MTTKSRLFFREHTHDEFLKPGGGGVISRALGNFTIGSGQVALDYTLTFDGESHDGVFTWMEDEDYLKASDDILMDSTELIYFRDTSLGIYSADDGYLDLFADTDVRINSYPVRPIPVGELRANFGTDPSGELGYGTWSEETAVGMTLYTLTIGIGAVGIDPRIDFDGDANDGILRWMDDEDRFQSDDDLALSSGENFYALGGDVVIDLATKGLVLKDTQGTPHYWRITVDNSGNLVVSDVGTTRP